MVRFIFSVLLLSSILIFPALAQIDSLAQQVEAIIAPLKAQVGVAILGLERGDQLTIDNDVRYPMQSVYKFHLALAVLHQVDSRKLSLDQKILIRKKDLIPNTWSPIAVKYPNGNIKLTIGELLSYTVSMSDNNGCDILFRLVGGPEKVNKYIHSIGVADVSIKATEQEMHKSWDVQFTNWTTPSAAVQLLEKFHDKKILSESSTEFLEKLMTETSTGPKRIKGNLPVGTIVAHKTGSSGTDEHGITAALNDIGIVTLPDGNHFAIGVFITDSKENEETNEKIIASVARAAWDYFGGTVK
jgi:beta-lactamase class A